MKAVFKLISLAFFVLILSSTLLTIKASSGGLTTVGTAEVPCSAKISAGGELRVPIDKDRKAALEIRNAADESMVTVAEYRNGQQRKGSKTETVTLDKNEYRKEWRFNKFFKQTPDSSVVDEIRVSVKKGMVYAEVAQTGENRIDFYNTGYQRGTTVNPKMSIAVCVTGDNPSGEQTSGNLVLESETWTGQKKVPFTVEKEKTLTWNYSAEKRISGVDVDILKGQAKVSLFQPSDYRKVQTVKTKAKTDPPPTAKTDLGSAGTKQCVKHKVKSSKTANNGSSSDMILNNEAPLIDGARIIKKMGQGANCRVDFEVAATPEEVIRFYKQTMSSRGWQPGMTMVQGLTGILQLSKGKSQLTLHASENGQKTMVKIALTTR